MAAPTLQSLIGNSADLAPLVANDTFRRAVDNEMAVKAAEQAAAVAANSKTEEVAALVNVFAGAMNGIRAVGKLPGCDKFAVEAAKQIQLAMGVVLYNPPPPAK